MTDSCMTNPGGTPPIVMVTTSVATRAEADTMARALVGSRLAACVQIVAIDSVHRWQEAIEQAPEFLLLAKARAADVPTIEDAIRSRHSYALPEIVAVPIIAGSAAYLEWVAAMTSR